MGSRTPDGRVASAVNVAAAVRAMLWEEDPRLSGDVEDVAGDAGGKTRFGISQLAPAPVDPAYWSMPREQALAYAIDWYTRFFCDVLQVEHMPGQVVANEVVSFAVNQGREYVARLLQESLRDCGAQIEVDGVIGNETAAAAKQADPKRLAVAILVRASFRYGFIEGQNPRLEKFELGWIRRAEDAAREA